MHFRVSNILNKTTRKKGASAGAQPKIWAKNQKKRWLSTICLPQRQTKGEKKKERGSRIVQVNGLPAHRIKQAQW